MSKNFHHDSLGFPHIHQNKGKQKPIVDSLGMMNENTVILHGKKPLLFFLTFLSSLLSPNLTVPCEPKWMYLQWELSHH